MQISNLGLLSDGPDISEEFYTSGNTLYYPAMELSNFDGNAFTGSLFHARLERKPRFGFNAYSAPFEDSQSWNFPPAYSDNPVYPIRFSFPAENVLRLEADYELSSPIPAEPSLMLAGELSEIKPIMTENADMICFTTSLMRVEVQKKPFSVAIYDKAGKLLTRTLYPGSGKNLQNCNPLPFSHLRRLDSMEKFSAVSMQIFPGEHFYGGGESFTPFDKRGQKLNLWTKDGHGVETQAMYKPVPFYFSSRGYGVFAHTSAAVTLDFGNSYQETQTVFIGEGKVDLFLITGTPKEILSAYTTLTGKSPLPPLWSFGLWMSRITYKSEAEAREVAARLREEEIPCDVIHLDTGWFEQDWRCDYEFAKSRFDNPEKMLADLKAEGFRICLWQLPYFTPQNPLYKEIIEKGLAVKTADGLLPTDDAILDFSSPEATRWYQEKLERLLKSGVAAIKADFGEAAPVLGQYHSGRSGKLEHNLYPLRYNKAASDITKSVTGSPLIWARSTWAGSQRYPLHWGGDAENTDMGMLASLRGGLSLGCCGFSFWSHDLGGFVRQSPEELYGRWAFMGIFTSHMRCHGAPPKEPWTYSPEFLKLFRAQMQLRYRLTPYIYAQAAKCSENGLPLLRAMVIECPNDPACLTLEDQYFFGDSILVAPLFENVEVRSVYLPTGTWFDLITGQRYEGGRYHSISGSELRGIALVKGGAALPMVEIASCTDKIDWDTLTYRHFPAENAPLSGYSYHPEKGVFPITAALI